MLTQQPARRPSTSTSHAAASRRTPATPPGSTSAAGQQIIRVLHEPGEDTLLIRLTPHSVCLYEAVFSPGTPDAVITAAIEAALSPPTPPLQAGPATPVRPQDGGARAPERMTRDDHR